MLLYHASLSLGLQDILQHVLVSHGDFGLGSDAWKGSGETGAVTGERGLHEGKQAGNEHFRSFAI